MLLVSLFACFSVTQASVVYSLELENFYGWNLPFAKTVSIDAKDGPL